MQTSFIKIAINVLIAGASALSFSTAFGQNISIKDVDGLNPAVSSCDNKLYIGSLTCSTPPRNGTPDVCVSSTNPAGNPDTLIELRNRDANFNDLGPNVCGIATLNAVAIDCRNWCSNEGHTAGTCVSATAFCPGTRIRRGNCGCAGSVFDRVFKVDQVAVDFGRHTAGTEVVRTIKVYSLSEQSGTSAVKMRLTGTHDGLSAPFEIESTSTCGTGAPVPIGGFCTIDVKFTAPVIVAGSVFTDTFVIIGNEVDIGKKQSFRIDLRGDTLP